MRSFLKLFNRLLDLLPKELLQILYTIQRLLELPEKSSSFYNLKFKFGLYDSN